MADDALLGTLMKLIQDKDHKAFETFYELTVDQLTIFLRAKTNLEVQDLLSLIYINIWEKAHMFNPNKGSVKSWILQMSKNIMISEHRKQKPTVDIDELGNVLHDDDQDPGKDAQLKLDSEDLYKVLGNLKKEYKDVVIFRFLEGYNIEETSEIMNISNANVRTTQHRALKELGKLLGR